MDVGLVGELLTQVKLIEHGWHTVRLDGRRQAPNADIVAIKGKRRVLIQVKTTGSGHGHSHCFTFGHASKYLTDGTSFFNSKNSPLLADFVVGVIYNPDLSHFVVMPVSEAENLARFHVDWWYKVPLRNKGQRTVNFSAHLAFTKIPKAHKEHHKKVQRKLQPYENAWHILDM